MDTQELVGKKAAVQDEESQKEAPLKELIGKIAEEKKIEKVELKDVDMTVSLPEGDPVNPLLAPDKISLMHEAVFPHEVAEKKGLTPQEVKNALLVHCIEYFRENKCRCDDFLHHYSIKENGNVHIRATSEVLEGSSLIEKHGIIEREDINPMLESAVQQ